MIRLICLSKDLTIFLFLFLFFETQLVTCRFVKKKKKKIDKSQISKRSKLNSTQKKKIVIGWEKQVLSPFFSQGCVYIQYA